KGGGWWCCWWRRCHGVVAATGDGCWQQLVAAAGVWGSRWRCGGVVVVVVPAAIGHRRLGTTTGGSSWCGGPVDGACRVALGSNRDGETITASPDEIKVVAPNKSDKIKIMSGAQRGATGKLIETFVANNTSGLVPQRQKASDYDNPDPVPQRQDVSSSADEHVPSQQELDLLFDPLYDEFFNAGSTPQDKQPSMNI
nr:putative transcription elongation factor SPT5 homolog 1 [Tanacetum cinerariifolium]